MRITPLDIQQKQFPVKFRGFHAEEVAGFLEQIREEIEDLLRENAALKERIQRVDEDTRRFWEMQDHLSRTLQEAHQTAEEFQIHARREADLLLEKAEGKIQDIVREAHEKAGRINGEILELKLSRRRFIEEMKTVLERFERVAREEASKTGSVDEAEAYRPDADEAGDGPEEAEGRLLPED